LTFWPLISRPFWIGHDHKSIGFIFLPISIIPENLTSIGQSVLELLSKIAKFDLFTSDKSAILDRALSQINRADLLTHIHHSWKFEVDRSERSKVIVQTRNGGRKKTSQNHKGILPNWQSALISDSTDFKCSFKWLYYLFSSTSKSNIKFQ